MCVHLCVVSLRYEAYFLNVLPYNIPLWIFLSCHSTRAIRVITAVVCIDYFVVSFVFDGLNYSGDIYSADPFLYIILNGLVEVPGYSLTAPIVDRWGRKIPTVVSYVLSGVVIFVIAFIPPGNGLLFISLDKNLVLFINVKCVKPCWPMPLTSCNPISVISDSSSLPDTFSLHFLIQWYPGIRP